MRIPRLAAFSLVELLVVIAIVIILASAALPALNSVMRGSNLNRGGQMISDQFALARQEAVSRNRDIQVCFYQMTNGGNVEWRALQLMRVDQEPTGPKTNISSRLVMLPDGINMATNGNLSPLITSGMAGSTNVPGYGQMPYQYFRFRADGSLDRAVVSGSNYVTLVSSTDKSDAPKNFFSIQINPLTGKSSVFRP